MRVTALALAAAIALPAAAFAQSSNSGANGADGASGSSAGVYGGESSSTTSEESKRGTASSTDGHNVPAKSQAGSGPDAARDMGGSGAANTGQKATTTPGETTGKNVGPREPGDLSGSGSSR